MSFEAGRASQTKDARGWTVRALGGVAVVGAFVLAGCGSAGGGHEQSVAQVQAPTPEATTQATPAVAVKPLVTSTGAGQRESGDEASMPPEVDVSVVDTLVAPGQVVELVAHGTPDVERMALKDGNGDTQPFVKDADGKTWRISYRVPLHPRYERAGLSVTARTGAERWRRVWVFLHVKGDEATPDTPPEIPGSAAGR
jgi:hypothetical protein